jgi:hypothetical protein
MGSVMRAVLAGIAAALWMVLADAAFDHEWPSRSATWWAIYVSGFVVIYGGAMVIESIVAAKRRRTAPDDRPTAATGLQE